MKVLNAVGLARRRALHQKPLLPVYRTADEVARAFDSFDEPLHCLYPSVLRDTARRFLTGLSGDVAYAVKCNPHPAVLRALANAGVTHFDVASMGEIEAVLASVPEARMHFMHPVKPRSAIERAWGHGIRSFSLDSQDELNKILQVLGAAPGLTLMVRLALPSQSAVYALEGKFGVAGDEAVALLRSSRMVADRLGVTFHVGSQCMDPEAFPQSLRAARALVDRSGVAIDMVDVGGGFPVTYPGLEPPPLDHYFQAIERGLAEVGWDHLPTMAEPGRAMVADGGSILVKVELRKGSRLYINDGTYGALFDAGTPKWRFPTRLIRPHGAPAEGPLAPFSFFGPTCDSLDAMDGPFMLPADVAEGDWIEVGCLGAYGWAMRSGFNSFDRCRTVGVSEGSAACP